MKPENAAEVGPITKLKASFDRLGARLFFSDITELPTPTGITRIIHTYTGFPVSLTDPEGNTLRWTTGDIIHQYNLSGRLILRTHLSYTAAENFPGYHLKSLCIG